MERENEHQRKYNKIEDAKKLSVFGAQRTRVALCFEHSLWREKMNTKENIIKFTEGFFNSLKCPVRWKGNVLVVENVKKDFEVFSGKKGPYYFVFDSSDEDDGTELLIKGSYLLKAMTSYLSNRGETTLIKISPEFSEQDLGKRLNLKNAEVSRITKKPRFSFITRFTFLTILQYLNEKEQIMNTFYLRDGEITGFNINNYRTIEGRKSEISIDNDEISALYEKAKAALREKMNPKLELVSKDLEEKLNSETERIKEHYENQLKEYEDEIKKMEKQISDLEKQIEKNPEKDDLKNKISKFENTLGELQAQNKKEDLEKEKEFFLKDELHKYSLNVNNKLMNTTIIYYPIFDVMAYIKNKEATRIFELKYDAVENSVSEIKCESCGLSLEGINMCYSGHLICEKCIGTCTDCQGHPCKICATKVCGICNKESCKNCSKVCSVCRKQICKTHSRKDQISAKDICVECSETCSECYKIVSKSTLKVSKLGKKICEVCLRNERKNSVLKSIRGD